MDVRSRLTPREGRRFAFTIGVAFALVGAVAWWRGHDIGRWVFWSLGAICLIAGVAAPGRLTGVYRAWMRFGAAISRITSPIIMGAVYFIVLTPVGWASRTFGRNPLRHRDRDGGYWMPASSGDAPDLENQF